MGEYYDSLVSRLDEDDAGVDGEGHMMALMENGCIRIVLDDGLLREVYPDDSTVDLDDNDEAQSEGEEEAQSEDEEEAQSEEEYTE